MLDSAYRNLLALRMTEDSPLNSNATASGVPKSWLERLKSLLRLIVFSTGSLYDNGCEFQKVKGCLGGSSYFVVENK